MLRHAKNQSDTIVFKTLFRIIENQNEKTIMSIIECPNSQKSSNYGNANKLGRFSMHIYLMDILL